MSVLPLYNVLVLPGEKLWLRESDYKDLSGKDPAEGERVTVLVQREEAPRAKLTEESFYPIGVSGVVGATGQNGFMSLELVNRVNIDEITVLPGGGIALSVSRRGDIADLDPQDAARRVAAVKERILTFSRGQQWESGVRFMAAYWNDLWTVGGAISPWLGMEPEERYAILAEDSLQRRFNALERAILENLERMEIQNEAADAQKEEHEKAYRESALRKQIEYLQKQLDELHPEEVTEQRRLELKLEAAGMNEEALKEGRKVLNRLKGEGKNSPEAGMLTDWLDLLTSLPWKKSPAKDISLDEARRVMDADHAGLDKVKKRILQQLAVMKLRGTQSGSILCFVGAPGTGKTSIGESIARALGREYVRISLGGVRDEADIRGHRRTYIGAMAGRIINGIHKCGVSNPVMVLDEVDKLSHSYNGDPASALLEVLDPEQNFSFTDHYLNVPFDLSDVLFICTANTLDTIPEPLLNRMEVVRFPGYTPIEKRAIAQEHLLPKARKAAGLPEGALTVTDDAVDALIGEYTREAGVRGLKKRIDQLCRSAAVLLLERPEETVTVTAENLREVLEDHPLRAHRVKDAARPGIVTGLAWTAVGGEILYIETLLTPGSGKTVITGQLGDVMKESAQIAVSLAKATVPEAAEVLSKNDLHIHVPDGATPKDGPSAGITLTTALVSLLTGRSVPPTVAMTGEVSLRGDVNPIGGLPEKLMAAQRAGVRRVFIPKDNRDDLADVAQEVRDGLELLPVERVEDVLAALELTPGPAIVQVG